MELKKSSDWKGKSGGCHVEVVPLIIFCDDVSGNVSKKWNKFDVWAMILAGLSQKFSFHLLQFNCDRFATRNEWPS